MAKRARTRVEGRGNRSGEIGKGRDFHTETLRNGPNARAPPQFLLGMDCWMPMWLRFERPETFASFATGFLEFRTPRRVREHLRHDVQWQKSTMHLGPGV